MKQILFFILVAVFVTGISYSQQDTKQDWGPIVTGYDVPSSKYNPNLNKQVSAEEVEVDKQMRLAKKMGDKQKVQQLNQRLAQVSGDIKVEQGALLPGNEITVLSQYSVMVANYQITTSSNTKAVATATEMRQATAGTLWTVVAQGTTQDTLWIYKSTNNGLSWTPLAFFGSVAGVGARINYDELDIEIIENTTGDKYLHGTYGALNGAKQITGWFSVRIVGALAGNSGLFAFPGDVATNRYFGARMTSDNAQYPDLAYTFYISAEDSVAGALHKNMEKFAYCTNPYATALTFTYRADAFFFITNTNVANYITTDIAYFDSGDSVVVIESNVPDTTAIYFITAYETGVGPRHYVGNYIGAASDKWKRYARIASPGNGRNFVLVYNSLFNGTGTDWDVRSLKSVNGTAIGSFTASTGPDFLGATISYQPDIMAVRNTGTFRAAHMDLSSPVSVNDSTYTDILNFATFVWTRKGVNNTPNTAPGSGAQGPKPSYRYVNADSCLTIWCITGPTNVWAATGCTGPILTGVEPINNGIPTVFSLSQNYPNPFNPVTNIKFSIPKAGLVKLVIFDITGKEVTTLIENNMPAGYYNADFDASKISSGVYFYQITSGDFTDTKKMVLIK